MGVDIILARLGKEAGGRILPTRHQRVDPQEVYVIPVPHTHFEQQHRDYQQDDGQ